MDIISYILSKKYTDNTVDGLGGIKGAPCTVKSVVDIDGGKRITLEWESNSGVKQTQSFDIMDGEDGANTVEWSQIQQSGTKIAEININGVSTNVYAPTNGSGSANIVNCTQAEYDTLPSSKESDDVLYVVYFDGGQILDPDYSYYTYGDDDEIIVRVYHEGQLDQQTLWFFRGWNQTSGDMAIPTELASYKPANPSSAIFSANYPNGGTSQDGWIGFYNNNIRAWTQSLAETTTGVMYGVVDIVGGDRQSLPYVDDPYVYIPDSNATRRIYMNGREYAEFNSGGGASVLEDLTDVSLNGLTNGQILKYNTTTQKWENSDESGKTPNVQLFEALTYTEVKISSAVSPFTIANNTLTSVSSSMSNSETNILSTGTFDLTDINIIEVVVDSATFYQGGNWNGFFYVCDDDTNVRNNTYPSVAHKIMFSNTSTPLKYSLDVSQLNGQWFIGVCTGGHTNLVVSAVAIGSGLTGHVIIDKNNVDMSQRSGLQFTGNVTVTDDSTNDKTVVNIQGTNIDDTTASGSTTYSSNKTNTLLNGKVDKISGKELSTNDYTNADKTKLEGIAEGAEVNTIASISVNGTSVTPDANRNVNIVAGGSGGDPDALTAEQVTALIALLG